MQSKSGMRADRAQSLRRTIEVLRSIKDEVVITHTVDRITHCSESSARGLLWNVDRRLPIVFKVDLLERPAGVDQRISSERQVCDGAAHVDARGLGT